MNFNKVAKAAVVCPNAAPGGASGEIPGLPGLSCFLEVEMQPDDVRREIARVPRVGE